MLIHCMVTPAFRFHLGGVQGRTKPRSNCPGQMNIEVQWPSGQVKLASVDIFSSAFEKISLINDNFQSEANSISKLKTARSVNHWVQNIIGLVRNPSIFCSYLFSDCHTGRYVGKKYLNGGKWNLKFSSPLGKWSSIVFFPGVRLRELSGLI